MKELIVEAHPENGIHITGIDDEGYIFYLNHCLFPELNGVLNKAMAFDKKVDKIILTGPRGYIEHIKPTIEHFNIPIQLKE